MLSPSSTLNPIRHDQDLFVPARFIRPGFTATSLLYMSLNSGETPAANSADGVRPAKSTCVECHRSQALSEPYTDMGHAMQAPAQNSTLMEHPDLTFQRGRYSYTVTTKGGRSTYTVSDGRESIVLPILWSMGANAQTWILEYNGRMYESLVSYYPDIRNLDETLGDETLAPQTLDEAIGRPLGDQDVRGCFRCHSSQAVHGDDLNLAGLEPGVNCAHCHTGADAHAHSMLANSTSAVFPPDLKKLSTQEISDFCGRCHGSFDLVAKAGWRGPTDVRFQPYRLALSECYDGTDPRISCIACHDPHQEIVRDSASYDAKCLACHSPKASTRSPYAKVCPVAKSRCVSCHMPRVKYPGGHFVFIDHYIRVVKPNEPYPY